MADWNTSTSRGKSAFQRFMDDPKKVILAIGAMACLLISVWAISFLDREEGTDAPAVAFSLPDPTEALSQPKSGFALAKAPVSAAKVEAAEVDALKALQTEAEKDVADSPAETMDAAEVAEEAEEADDSDAVVEGEDERGAPGRPIAEQSGFFAGGGGAGGGGGFVPSAGGVGGNGSSGASSAGGVGPNVGAADGGPGPRQVQGATSSGRTLTASGRSLRSDTAGTTSGAAGSGFGENFNKFAPTGASGSVYAAGPGVTGGSPVGGAGAGTGGGGAGLRNEGGGGGVADGAPGGNPEPPGGGGGNPPGGPDTGPGGGGGPGPGGDPPGPVTPKNRKEVEQDAAEVLKTAKSYRRNVVVKIMAQEKSDVTLVAARAKRANALLKADVKELPKIEAKLGAFPAAAAALADGRLFIDDHARRFLEGGTTLTAAAKVISKVPAQCTTKEEHATAQGDGTEVDPKGVLQAHRDADAALKRVSLARVAVEEYQKKFTAEWPAHDTVVRLVDPKLADAYRKAASDLDKDLKKIVKSLPPTLYPTKGKGKKAKRDMAKKLKPIKLKNAKGVEEFQKRQEEIKAAHRTYPDTADLKKAEDSSWLAVEGASQVDAMNETYGKNLLTAAETFLPALVQAGENAAEAYMESCDQWAAMKRLAKDAPR